MATVVTFPFQNKEGKYFAPISSSEPDFKVVSGAIVANGEKIISGIKGAFILYEITSTKITRI